MATKTILLIASEEKIDRNVHRFLEPQKFFIITAKNNRLALEIFSRQPLDLIICQLRTPQINGYKLLTELRQKTQIFTIPFIFITTEFDAEQWRKAINLGADDFLLQPISASELQTVVATRLAKQEALVNKYQQELEHLRSSILGFLPHEMRTALTGILASSDLLISQLEELDLSIVRDVLGCIDSSSKRLSRLVHNFLLYSELNLIIQNSEQIELLRLEETASCQETIELILKKLGKIYNRQEEIKWSIEDATLAISSLHLAKLVEELVDNACKFSAVNKPIEVIGIRDNDYLILSVSDRGRGMTTSQTALIGACIQFDRPTYEQQGAGLGLAIVKQLVQIYGGKLTIDSILNQETKVTVSLPLAKPCLSAMATSKQIALSPNGVISASIL